MKIVVEMEPEIGFEFMLWMREKGRGKQPVILELTQEEREELSHLRRLHNEYSFLYSEGETLQ